MPTSPPRDRIACPGGSAKDVRLSDGNLLSFPETNYLRRHKLGRSTKSACAGPIPHVFLAQPVIRNLYVAVHSEQNVIELQVAVYDAVLVEVLQCQTNFCRVKPRWNLASRTQFTIDKNLLLRPLGPKLASLNV